MKFGTDHLAVWDLQPLHQAGCHRGSAPAWPAQHSRRAGNAHPEKTGSFEQASYGIHDTPEMAQQHYGRFLPQEKTAIAAQVLNKVWDD
jgi:hypothetical protein